MWLPAQPLSTSECVVHAEQTWGISTHGFVPWNLQITGQNQDILTRAWAGPAWYLAHRGLPHMPGCPKGQGQV